MRPSDSQPSRVTDPGIDAVPAGAKQPGRTETAPSLLPASPHAAAVRTQLAKMAPRLWGKALLEHKGSREQHQHLNTLVDWFLKKQGLAIETSFRQSYFDHGRVVQGRIDLIARHAGDASGLTVEIAFKPTSAAAYKLLSSKRDGHLPLLLCGFATSPEAAHEILSRLCGRPTSSWFPVACLLDAAEVNAKKNHPTP